MTHPGFEPASVTFVAVLRGISEWGVEASKVQAIMPAMDWSGPEPTDAAAQMGFSPASDDHARVLVVETADGTIALWAGREIRIRSHARTEVLRLPALLFAPETKRIAVSSVVMSAADRPLFVLDTALLDRRAMSVIANDSRNRGARAC